jgi:tryptophan synthase beta chain
MATPAPTAVPDFSDFHAWPDPHGRFGQFGGQYVA